MDYTKNKGKSLQKLPLRSYNATRADFDGCMKRFAPIIEKVDDLQDYMCGYGHSKRKGLSKEIMLYGKLSGEDCLILPEYKVNENAGAMWKQIVLRKKANLEVTDKESDANGSFAYNWVMDIVHSHYSEKEIEKIFEEFSADFDQDFRQFHFDYRPEVSGMLIYRITDCVKYDINGAHCDALCEIFPECREDFAKFYMQRKKNPKIKKYFNYAVGMLKRRGHEKTYNWIVQRTTDKLLEAIQYVGGELIYANTDSLVVKTPERFLKASKELGEFKEEFKGDVYFYQDKNYNLYQFGNQLVGRAWQEVRQYIDLSKGSVAHYDVIKEKVQLMKGEYFAEHLGNIEKEKLKIWQI